ncbi:hypothetical protein [Leekyejoonella antrihumi]|uniref:Uncharacterized protein n=1 Tax=Leekyejoonella antrihumi TaxID=1660198 RepID=A0A563DVL4_9MICO|nr:hypothetical protein [Leekyejoonella antrihumi]TWP34308.1 hypothetical protein FGL98_17905 [Leekyejoonella antrihumi]
MNPVSAALLRVFGPSDSPGNPLVGTKYDPTLAAQRGMERTARHHAQVNAGWQRWDKRLHGHNPVPPYKISDDAAPDVSTAPPERRGSLPNP